MQTTDADQVGMVADWIATLVVLAEGWKGLASVDDGSAVVADWQRRLRELSQENDRLKRAGLWSRGPTDLLSICGVRRWELAHSAVLAWLFDPEAKHGYGGAFLEGFAELTGGAFDATDQVSVATEVTRPNSRADIIVTGNAWTLIVEVKVDAVEQELQCKRLYEDWSGESDPRFVFLTKTGYEPLQAGSEAVRRAWRPLTWPVVTELLDRVVSSRDAGPAGNAVAEYLSTLKAMYGGNR